jgi:hypothetical protein
MKQHQPADGMLEQLRCPSIRNLLDRYAPPHKSRKGPQDRKGPQENSHHARLAPTSRETGPLTRRVRGAEAQTGCPPTTTSAPQSAWRNVVDHP